MRENDYLRGVVARFRRERDDEVRRSARLRRERDDEVRENENLCAERDRLRRQRDAAVRRLKAAAAAGVDMQGRQDGSGGRKKRQPYQLNVIYLDSSDEGDDDDDNDDDDTISASGSTESAEKVKS